MHFVYISVYHMHKTCILQWLKISTNVSFYLKWERSHCDINTYVPYKYRGDMGPVVTVGLGYCLEIGISGFSPCFTIVFMSHHREIAHRKRHRIIICHMLTSFYQQIFFTVFAGLECYNNFKGFSFLAAST